MILLITPSQRGSECATAIETAIAQPAQAVKSFQEATFCLRAHNYTAVVIDECLLDAEPDQASLVLKHIQTAIPIYVNGAINGISRIVEKVQSALQRRTHDEAAARLSALASLRSELREPLTGIILNCELILDVPNVAFAVKDKVRAVHDLARQLGAKFQLDEARMSIKGDGVVSKSEQQ
jgi:signal transduction histidine kinase